MIKRYFVLPILLLGLVIVSCNSKQGNGDKTAPSAVSRNKTSSVDSVSSQKVKMIIGNIPFPINIMDDLYKQHANYNKSLLNPLTNVSKYSISQAKALNLGIYGADLAYVISFEQFNEIGPYMKNTKQIADNLDIPMAFGQDIIDRCKNNQNNKDSLCHIIYDSYTIVDKTLKSNERMGMAALVVTGGWIEGLYLSTQTLSGIDQLETKQKLDKIIWGEEKNLNDIISLMQQFEKEPYYAKIVDDLKDLKTAYELRSVKKQSDDVVMQAVTSNVAKLRKEAIEGTF